MTLAEELVQASENQETLLTLFKRNLTKDDTYDLDEVLMTLDKKQLDLLWSHVQSDFTGVILSFSPDNENYEQSCAYIQGVVTMAMGTITLDNLHLPQPLIQTALVLHGVLLSLPADLDKLKNSIAYLFEYWWKTDLPHKHELATHTLIYLMQRTENVNALKVDVKRIYQMHEVLVTADLTSESGISLQRHLQLASFSMVYLKSDEGRKFLSFVLNQTAPVVDMLHATIKHHLPWAPKSIMSLYGEIYFRAWRNARGRNQEKLVENCIQDFMYHAILAQPELSSSLRKILGYIHQQKLQKGVDPMLVRLYEPILWRHLKVANGQVRLQAVMLLIDAFPLHTPEWNVQERDDMLQKQFDTLREMVYDPLPAVRATVAQGICIVCDKYWELIPSETIKDLINCVINDMAYDGASADVRVAVFRGLTKLVDNPLTHPMLKLLLPQLSNCFHDTSEKVRVTFVDMLLKVKQVKAVKFWEVVPLNHLLSRLEVDSAPVARRLVKLLLTSYLPADKEVDDHVTRCISLIEINPGAARRFHQYVAPHTTLGTAVRLMAAILMMFESHLEKLNQPARQTRGKRSALLELDFLETFDETKQDNTAASQPSDAASDEEDDPMNNLDTVAGLLEVVSILWISLTSELNKESASEMRHKLEHLTSRILPRLFSHHQKPRIMTALFKLSGLVPPNMLPTISRSLVSKLRRMTDDTPHDEYVQILDVLCLWHKVKDVLELISDWLNYGLHGKCVKEKRRSKSVSFAEPGTPQPLLAHKFMCHLTQSKICRNVLLSRSNRAALRELTDSLQAILKCVEGRLQSPSSSGDHCTDDFLVKTFELYLKLEILLHDKTKKEDDSVTVVEHILSWVDMELLALLKKKTMVKKSRKLLGQTEMTLLAEPSVDGATLGSQTACGTMLSMASLNITANETLSDTVLDPKRSGGNGQTGMLKTFAMDLIQRLVNIASDMLLVGLGDRQLASHLADFSILLLKIDNNSASQFLPAVSRLMFQIAGLTLAFDDDDEGVGSHGDIVSSMVCKLLEVIVVMTSNRKEQAQIVLPAVKPALSEILSAYYHHHSLNNTLQHAIMANMAAAIISDMTTTIQQDKDYEPRPSLQELPMLTSFLLASVWKRTSLIGLLLTEVQRCIMSGAVTSSEAVTGICHLLHTISQCKRTVPELKECVNALDNICQPEGNLLAKQQGTEDSPVRDHIKVSRILLEGCRKQIVMV